MAARAVSSPKEQALAKYLDTFIGSKLPRDIAKLLPAEEERLVNAYSRGTRGRRAGYDYQTFLRVLRTIVAEGRNLLDSGYSSVKSVVVAANKLYNVFASLGASLLPAQNPVEAVRAQFGPEAAELYSYLVKEFGDKWQEARALAQKLAQSIYEKYRRNYTALINKLAEIYLEYLARESPVVIKLNKFIPGMGYESTIYTRGPKGEKAKVSAITDVKARETCKGEERCIVPVYEYTARVKIPATVIGSTRTGWLLTVSAYPVLKMSSRGSAWNNVEFVAASADYRMTLPELEIIMNSELARNYKLFASSIVPH